MSFTYPAGILSKTPVTPAGPYAEGAASGIWKLSEVDYWIQQGIWPQASNPTPNDPYFQYVTSLLHGDGTNGGQNNTFLDSSSNAFTITRNGNTTQGSFSPYGSNWGNYFNGSSRLSLASNSAFAFGTGDFTIEFWMFQANTSSYGIFTTDQLNVSNSLQIYTESNGGLTAQFSGSPEYQAQTGALSKNVWHHCALVRTSGTSQWYIDGVATGSSSSTPSNITATSSVLVGSFLFSGSYYDFTGYLSNLRITKGGALYTSNFTPSTTPLTTTVSSGTVSLLTCQSNRFIDNSVNAFALTVGGTPQVTRFSPFAPTYSGQYSASTIGGSGYFDGSGDYLTVASNSAFAFGSGDFCIEFFVYVSSALSNYDEFVGVYPGSGNPAGWSIFVDTSKYLTFGTHTANLLVDSSAFPTNQWVHVAVSRSGTTLSMYRNGVRVATATDSTSLTQSGLDVMGKGTGNEPNGYMTDLRLVKGSSVYTPSNSTITVPTSPLTAVSNTQLLCNMTNAAIYDNAMIPDYETVGNAQISTSVKKYGTGSLSLSASGNTLKSPSSQDTNVGSGNFTIEGWVYFTTVQGSGDGNGVFQMSSTAGGFVGNQTNNLALGSSEGTGWQIYAKNTYTVGTMKISSGTWYHFALCRAGSVTKLFINGTVLITLTGDTTTYNTPYVGLGSIYDATSYPTRGYIDDFRITKGYARYWENFTPPTAALPNFGGAPQIPTQDPQFPYTTMLLSGNGTNGAQNNTFLDSSTNAFTITRNGNTTQGTFTPYGSNWGNYFDGTSDYLNYGTNTNTQLGGATNFTIEAWVFPTAYNSYGPIVTNSASGTLGFGKLASGFGIRKWGSGDIVYTTTTPPIGQWTHVAAVKSGNNYYIFYNGTIQATATSSETYSNGNFSIGGDTGAATEAWIGYISNVRFINNQALSTTNFTPPTSPLTTTSVGWTGSGVASSITGTVGVLACQSNRFIDNSGNSYTISVGGTPSVQRFSPFSPTASYSAATIGGSGYFDGTGDNLYAAANSAFSLSGDFTIEGWVYPTGLTSELDMFCIGNQNSGGLLLYVQTSTQKWRLYSGGELILSSSTVKNNAWYHVAVVRSGSTITLYVNGTSVGTTTNSSTFDGSSGNGVVMGGSFDGSYTSSAASFYMGGFRVVKGTAVYTTTFTPPTTPLTAISNTSFLANYTNAGITDSAEMNDLETVGNAQISTTQSKFGGSSLYFNGGSDALALPGSPNLTFGTGDFTVEGWIYPTSVSGEKAIIGNVLTNTTTTWVVEIYNNKLRICQYSPILLTSNSNITANTWTHFAITRYGSTLMLFINGILDNSTTDSTNFSDSTTAFRVGDVPYGAKYLGYIDDLRLTKGYARYVQPFTPPTQAFQTY